MIIGCFVIYMLYVLSIYDVNGLGTRDEEKLPSEIHGRVEKVCFICCDYIDDSSHGCIF